MENLASILARESVPRPGAGNMEPLRNFKKETSEFLKNFV